MKPSVSPISTGNVSLLVDRMPVDEDRLSGLKLATLDAVLNSLNMTLANGGVSQRRKFTDGIANIVRAIRGHGKKQVTIDVTTFLDPETKTLKHTFVIR